jgi:SNF2 family DNA or RNA helicase
VGSVLPSRNDNTSANNIKDGPVNDSDDDLFVSPSGYAKKLYGCIDLTEETEAESNARALRIGFLPGGADVKIKQEESKDKIKLLPDSEKGTESDTPEDMEEALDRLEVLRLEQAQLEKRRERNGLKPKDARSLDEVKRKIRLLQRRIEQSAFADEAARSQGPTRDEHRSVSSPSPAPEGPARRKRKPTTQPKARAARNKRRKPAPLATRRRRGRAAEDSTKLILDLLQNQDAFVAGQEMAGLLQLNGFKATTVEEQEEHLRNLLSNGLDADKQQIQGDRIMIKRARSALARRYKVVGEKYHLAGMKTPLIAYQLVGAGWMVGREKSSDGPQGGILADAMGLDKTVQALACIAGHPPSAEDLENGLRTTLIVVPANAVDQWIAEVWKHCDGILVSQYKMSDITNQGLRDISSIW